MIHPCHRTKRPLRRSLLQPRHPSPLARRHPSRHPRPLQSRRTWHLPSLQHHQEKPKYQKRPKRQEKIRRVKLQGFTRLIFKVIARFSFCPSSEASPILSTAYIHAISKSIQNHPISVNLQHSFSHGKPLCRSSNFS